MAASLPRISFITTTMAAFVFTTCLAIRGLTVYDRSSGRLGAKWVIVEVRVCYSSWKHNIFSTKAKESFVVARIAEEICLKKRATRFCNSTFKSSLTFALYTKTKQIVRGEVVEASFCYYSRDSHEIVRKFPCMD